MTIDENKGMMNYKVVNEDLEKLFEAVANLLEREWDDRYRNVDSARVIFFTSVRIAINTYSTIMYICADTPTDPDRRPVYALSLPPLTRTLFEQLITFLFLIEDIPSHIPYLFRTGYTERKIELAHCVKYHGSDPIWRNYISSLTKQIALEENLFSLTPDEITYSTKKIGRWPTPGIMLNKLREEHPGSAVIPTLNTLILGYTVNCQDKHISMR